MPSIFPATLIAPIPPVILLIPVLPEFAPRELTVSLPSASASSSFGAAAAASSLTHLSPAQMLDALGSAGTQAAQNFIATTGPGTLTNPQISTSTLSGNVAQVTVTGRAQALIPWLDLTVSATSDAPIQEYRTSG